MSEEKVATGEMSIEEMTLKVMASMTAKVQRLELERTQHVAQIEPQKPAVEFVKRFPP